MKILISEINNNNFNPFSATAEELVANALNESGLLSQGTRINNTCAKILCQVFYKKRETYKKTTKLGNILVRNSIISEDQLDKALELQKKQPSSKLGETLKNLDYCSGNDIDSGLKIQTKERTNLHIPNSAKKTGAA